MVDFNALRNAILSLKSSLKKEGSEGGGAASVKSIFVSDTIPQGKLLLSLGIYERVQQLVSALTAESAKKDKGENIVKEKEEGEEEEEEAAKISNLIDSYHRLVDPDPKEVHKRMHNFKIILFVRDNFFFLQGHGPNVQSAVHYHS